MMTFVVAGACVCVTCCSSMAGSTYDGMTVEYGISRLVATLTISVSYPIAVPTLLQTLTGKLYVAGLGVGPSESLAIANGDWGSPAELAVFLGPVSEFIGRKKVLHYSFACFFRQYTSALNIMDPVLTL